tara:strand:+ start:38 stop:661 length:624 start_codon:yes stop_codon:yes gene_type:complete
MKVEKKKIKAYKIKGNPDNPRIIRNDKFRKLIKSIQEFPEMMEIRPIVVDENMMVLGGNMRLKASKDAGMKDVWIELAEGLTDEQKKEFTIKDNVGFGEWEWDILANEWDSGKLDDWGLDVWQSPDEKIDEAEEGETIDVPQSLQVLPKKEYIIICEPEDSPEWLELKEIFGCKTVRMGGCKINSSSDLMGLERVFNLKKFKERVGL